MLSNRAKGALELLVDRLSDTDVRWCVVASAALALQGAYRIPHDIDIQTDLRGVKLIAKLFKDSIKIPLKKTAKYSEGYFMTLSLNGMDVEIVGAKSGSIFTNMLVDDKNIINVNCGSLIVPCMTVDATSEFYLRLGRHADARYVMGIIARKKVKQRSLTGSYPDRAQKVGGA